MKVKKIVMSLLAIMKRSLSKKIKLWKLIDGHTRQLLEKLGLTCLAVAQRFNILVAKGKRTIAEE